MSLEDSINKLTVAVENLTQTMTTLTPTVEHLISGAETLVVAFKPKHRADAEPEAPKKSRKKAAAPATTFQEAHQAADELIAKHSLAPVVEPEVAIAVEGAGPSEPAPEPAAEPEVAIAVEPEPAPALVAEPVKITLQDIRELAQVALDNDKLSGVIAINKKFGLRRISEATEDQYTEIHELLTKLTHGTS